MAKVDFITLANLIFKDKDKYKFISDEEKELNFFKLNRKFAFKFLKQAQFFNNRNVDKPSALDTWYQIFYKTKGTPQWCWKTKQKKKDIKVFNDKDINLLKEYFDINDNDINFLVKYYEDKVKEEIIRIKKFYK